LGNALIEKGLSADAIAAYRRALDILPNHSAAHYNLGIALRAQGQLEDSMAALRRAVELKPDHVDALVNLGNALCELRRFDDAHLAFERALLFQPNNAEAHYNLGALFAAEGERSKAAGAYRHALETCPGHHFAKFNLSLIQLAEGDHERGWEGYEARLETTGSGKREFGKPIWRGEGVEGRRVLIHAEQGFGDSIQFIRYAPMVAKRGACVIVECPHTLTDLFSRIPGVNTVVAAGDRLPDFDLHVPMLSQPRNFRTVTKSIPREVPYLSVDSERRAEWSTRLGGDQASFRVGLAWTGDPRHHRNLARSFPLELLIPKFECTNIAFYNLQVGHGSEGIRKIQTSARIIDHTNQISDFSDTAALMMELDLVISADTAVAHLAGALGRPVWTLLPFVPDWRWGLEGETTPWYPTMRLFRQPKLGDWDSVIQRVAEELKTLVENRIQ
jgi:hypothetical protein